MFALGKEVTGAVGRCGKEVVHTLARFPNGAKAYVIVGDFHHLSGRYYKTARIVAYMVIVTVIAGIFLAVQYIC